MRKGWIVRSIQGQDMGGMDFESKYQMFVDVLSALPGGMEIVFTLPDGSERACQFRQQQLGIDFKKTTPIKVDAVFPHSHAAEPRRTGEARLGDQEYQWRRHEGALVPGF